MYNTTAELVEKGGAEGEKIAVRLSNELVKLLSEQLYQSPLKAIEELVVNAYDADAPECRVYVPDVQNRGKEPVLVFDSGTGMDAGGLTDLWHIGRSNKRDAQIEKLRKRKQIGKFGIGKLATYAIAHHVTYLSKTPSGIRGVSIDYGEFKPDETGVGQPVEVKIKEFTNADALLESSTLRVAVEGAGLQFDALDKLPSWTIVVLDVLKAKAKELHVGHLRQVLRTAMPLGVTFQLFLNGDAVPSSKSELVPIVVFQVADLPADRVKELSESTQDEWQINDGRLLSTRFQLGVHGEIIVTEQSLVGKSDDLARSNGFFVRVRGRLINESDHLFGLSPRSHQVMNRFRADIDVDDLDRVLIAPREGIVESPEKKDVQAVLLQIFNEARERYIAEMDKRSKAEKYKTEEERAFVSPRLVEHPVADALNITDAPKGAEADETWFYVSLPPEQDFKALSAQLYQTSRSKFRYNYASAGRTARLVRFDPATATFVINEDHDLVAAYGDEGPALRLLEDFATAEALLEVYLREHGVRPPVVGEILEQRDALLRGLVMDHPFSVIGLAQQLRDSAADERDLEVALIGAARALGFVAKHVSGSGDADGIARFIDYEKGEVKVTLEAKSSANVPSLAAIDFAGLASHMKQHAADGCLLVAPAYPGSTAGEDAEAAQRARQQRVSCWTVEQLARVLAAAETRHISARHILDIVLEKFSPDEVSAAVIELLRSPAWDMRNLYNAVLRSLRRAEGRLPGSLRSVEIVAYEISGESEFTGITKEQVDRAVRDVAAASQGLLSLRDDKIIVHGDFDEIERRLNSLLGKSGPPRRAGNFRE
jgi:histidine kinase/DNA gyrase B/HSP90-like ATPase